MKDEYIRKRDAVDAVAFGITIASAFNNETGERIDLFVKENDELRKAIRRIHDLPSADVAPVIRCKDCNCHGTCTHEQYLGLDSFCSYGERREE